MELNDAVSLFLQHPREQDPVRLDCTGIDLCIPNVGHKWAHNINQKLWDELFAYFPLIRQGSDRTTKRIGGYAESKVIS
jgi:hypothetical protein